MSKAWRPENMQTVGYTWTPLGMWLLLSTDPDNPKPAGCDEGFNQGCRNRGPKDQRPYHSSLCSGISLFWLNTPGPGKCRWSDGSCGPGLGSPDLLPDRTDYYKKDRPLTCLITRQDRTASLKPSQYWWSGYSPGLSTYWNPL